MEQALKSPRSGKVAIMTAFSRDGQAIHKLAQGNRHRVFEYDPDDQGRVEYTVERKVDISTSLGKTEPFWQWQQVPGARGGPHATLGAAVAAMRQLIMFKTGRMEKNAKQAAAGTLGSLKQKLPKTSRIPQVAASKRENIEDASAATTTGHDQQPNLEKFLGLLSAAESVAAACAEQIGKLPGDPGHMAGFAEGGPAAAMQMFTEALAALAPGAPVVTSFITAALEAITPQAAAMAFGHTTTTGPAASLTSAAPAPAAREAAGPNVEAHRTATYQQACLLMGLDQQMASVGLQEEGGHVGLGSKPQAGTAEVAGSGYGATGQEPWLQDKAAYVGYTILTAPLANGGGHNNG